VAIVVGKACFLMSCGTRGSDMSSECDTTWSREGQEMLLFVAQLALGEGDVIHDVLNMCIVPVMLGTALEIDCPRVGPGPGRHCRPHMSGSRSRHRWTQTQIVGPGPVGEWTGPDLFMSSPKKSV
jgi:hypothetical protein